MPESAQSLAAEAQPAKPTPLRAAAHAVLLACCAGALSGTLHALILLIKRFGFGELIFHSRDVTWMAPVGTAIVFGGFALLAVIPALLLRWRIPPALPVGVFAFLGVFTILLPFGELARWSAALLAVGIAIHLARSASRRWSRRILLWGAGCSLATLAIGIGQHATGAIRRAVLLHGLPQTEGSMPNILLIILDTVRGTDLSLYGHPRPTTPALERWAARGVVFDFAFSTAPWTLPSHGSLFTGQPASSIGGTWRTPITTTAPTLAELLRARGYHTAGFVANLSYTSYESGLARGFVDYWDYPFSLRQFFLHVPLVQTSLFRSVIGARSLWELREALLEFGLRTDRVPASQVETPPAGEVTDKVLRWQAGVGNRPFFAFVNYIDAHGPYRSPPEFVARFASNGGRHDRYEAAIAYLDSELDRLFTTLESRGVLQKTLVVVSSDHGELFGGHSLYGHANSLYFNVLRVPLLLMYEKLLPAGVRVSQPVSLRDIPATLLNLVTGAPRADVPGHSLVGSWDPARAAEPPSPVIAHVIRQPDPTVLAPNARTWLESALDDRYHYIRSGLGKEELYAWRTDSLELVNLAASPGGRAVIKRLRARLEHDSLSR